MSDEPFKLLDLFSGIGGFSLGLERSRAFKVVAFCEIEPFCRRVLAKHWPEVPCYEDIRELTADRLAADGIAVDAICGGFPCQDISYAGKGAGLAGERSGLWREYARLIGELRPRYVIVENVAALLSRGLGDVLGDLAALGFDAEWHIIRASRLGACHERERVWIIADRNSQGRQRLVTRGSFSEARSRRWGGQADLCTLIHSPYEPGDFWPQPLLRRVDDGISKRVDRIKSCGNAVYPSIPELIGRAIAQAERMNA